MAAPIRVVEDLSRALGPTSAALLVVDDPHFVDRQTMLVLDLLK